MTMKNNSNQASTEPMYLISESEITQLWNKGYQGDLKEVIKICERLSTRGPVQQYPNSTELLAMAHQDWKNREERRGLHGENDWCAGWITGFLTPTKPVAQQAPAITLPKDMTTLECIDEGLKGLSDYFNAAVEGGESKAALRRMWDQQMGIVFALLKNYQQAPFACPYVCERVCIENVEEHDAALLAREREKWEREQYTKNAGLFGITNEEIGQIIEITENLCFHESTDGRLVDEEHVKIARQRIELINIIKSRGTVPSTTPLISFGKHALDQHDTAIAARARKDVLKNAAIAILKEAGIPETSVSHYTPKQDSDIPAIRVDKVVHILESLRSEVGK